MQNTTRKERLSMATNEQRAQIETIEFMIKTSEDELFTLRAKHRQSIADLAEKRSIYNALITEMQAVNDNIKHLKSELKITLKNAKII